MTEKRFVSPDGGLDTDVTLIDTLTGKEYEDNFNDIVDLMNDLHEENKLMENHLEILRLHRDILMGKNRELRNEILKYQENIKSAIQSERTELGSSVLRNLASNLRIEL